MGKFTYHSKKIVHVNCEIISVMIKTTVFLSCCAAWCGVKNEASQS